MDYPRPLTRPGFYPPPPFQNPDYNPNPNPNPSSAPPPSVSGGLPDAMRNLQIARPPPTSAVSPRPIPFSSSPHAQFAGPGPNPAMRPGPPPAGNLQSRPPPPSFTSRPPPPGAIPAVSNGPPPMAAGPPPPRFPAHQQPLIAPPASVRAPPPDARHFPGSPPPPSPAYSAAVPTGVPLGPPPAFHQKPAFMGPPPPAQVSEGVTTAAVSTPSFGAPQMGLSPLTSGPQFGAGSQVQGGMAMATASAPPFRAPPMGPPPLTSGPQFGAGAMAMAAPSAQPFGAPPMGPPPLTSAPQFGAGAPTWQRPVMMDPSQAPGRTYNMPPGMPGQSLPPVPPIMGQSPSKIDPNQIPRPMPSSSVMVFETLQGNQPNMPPPATGNFIVKDTGNCSPRLMRCTINQVPCTSDLLSTSGMPLALMVQPFAIPHPSEEPIQIVDFGEGGPLRCSRCKAYINPFMRFIDHGRHFICNLCGFTDETPRDYFCNLGPDGRRRDADERPELCRGSVEFVATKEYMVREPMAAVFFFLIDVSMNAIQTGATASACNAISQVLADLPEGPRTMVGIATFDCSIHFYSLKRALQQPLMLIVPDIQDVYTPLHTDLVVPLSECRQHMEQLLENIPTMFEDNKVAESGFGAAVKAAFLALKPTGGKLLVFQSVLPSVGIGSLSSREAEARASISTGDKEAHKLFQPADKNLKIMAIEFAEYQVCVDLFITAQSYVDIASISAIPSTTGGQVYYYHPFSAFSDSAKLFNDLRWNISRPQGFEAVMRVRCSQGLQVQEYSGNFCKRIPTDIDLPGIDSDKTIMVTFKHDDKLQDASECGFQCALLYTTMYGQRRIRVINLSLPCTSMLTNLFRSADLDAQFACFLKQAANGIPNNPLSQVREQINNLCINILHAYRKFCATVSSSGQLILPEALKLLPLYTLALSKSIGLRNDGRLDDRSYWISRATTLSVSLAIPLVYPRVISLHDLTSQEEDESLLSSTIPPSSEHISDDGIYLLENGEDGLIYVGNMVNSEILHQIFGLSSLDALPSQLMLKQFDNELSRKVNHVVNEIRRQRCSYLRLHLCRKGDPSGMLFFSYMVEDKTPGGLSYVEFLVHVHRQIQTKMA